MLQQMTFAQMISQLTSVYSALAKKPANVGVGSSLGSVFNAVALLVLNIQIQTLYINNISRLNTSVGSDIDSFVNVFGIFRELATYATDSVIYTMNSVSAYNSIIPVGTVCQTPLGVQFTVIENDSQSAWSAGNNGYVIPAGSLTVQVTVEAVTAGSSGNVLAQTISQLVSVPALPAPSGFTVANLAAFTNGKDEESDTALIQRFTAYIANRWATLGAVAAAVGSVQENLTYTVGDMLDAYGNYAPNFFTVWVNVANQNSGCPSNVLSAVNVAVLASRPVGMPFQIISPVLVPVNVSGTLTLQPGASPNSVISAVNTVIGIYLNGIGLSPTGSSTNASFSAITALIVEVPGVANLTNLLLNGSTFDVSAGIGQQIVSNNFNFTTV